MMTKITRDGFQGKIVTFERDNADKRGLAPRKRDRANNTKPARTRDGAKFPGGKHMRHAYATLSARRNSAKAGKTLPGSLNY